jgi:hypothetical protein
VARPFFFEYSPVDVLGQSGQRMLQVHQLVQPLAEHVVALWSDWLWPYSTLWNLQGIDVILTIPCNFQQCFLRVSPLESGRIELFRADLVVRPEQSLSH